MLLRCHVHFSGLDELSKILRHLAKGHIEFERGLHNINLALEAGKLCWSQYWTSFFQIPFLVGLFHLREAMCFAHGCMFSSHMFTFFVYKSLSQTLHISSIYLHAGKGTIHWAFGYVNTTILGLLSETGTLLEFTTTKGSIYFQKGHTLPETNSSRLKNRPGNQKEMSSSNHWLFRGYV